MLHGFWSLIWVLLQQQLRQLEAGEGYLRAEAYLAGRLECLVVVAAGLVWLAQQRGRRP